MEERSNDIDEALKQATPEATILQISQSREPIISIDLVCCILLVYLDNFNSNNPSSEKAMLTIHKTRPSF